MMILSGHKITETLYESDNSLVYRGLRQSDKQPVVLKMLKDAYPSPEKIAWFKQEYERTRKLKLQGVVTWFDNFCVLLRRDGHSQLVYKHAISTIMPGHPVQLFEGGEEGAAGDKT